MAHGPLRAETLDSEHAGREFLWGRPVKLRPVGLVLTLILGFVGVTAAIPATAATTPDEGDTTGIVSLTVSPLDISGLSAPSGNEDADDDDAASNDDGDLVLTVTVDNNTAQVLPVGTIRTTINRTPLASTTALSDWDDAGANSITATTPLANTPSPQIPAGQTRTITVTVPAENLRLTERGVYAIGSQLDSGTEDVANSRTSIVWNTTATNPVRVSIIAPLVLPDATPGILDATLLEEYTAPAGLLTEQLNAMIGSAVTIGIDPRIIASIRLLGSAAPDSAVEWLDRLRGAPNETFPLAYADADITSPQLAGVDGIIPPKSFDFAMDPANFSVDANITPQSVDPEDAETTDDPAAPTLPTVAELLEWDYDFRTLAWPSENAVTAATLTGITESGFGPTILSSDNVAFAGNVSRETPRSPVATVGTSTVAVSDSHLSGLLRDAVDAPTIADWHAAMASLASSTALISNSTNPGSPTTVLATLSRDWSTQAYRLDRTLSDLSDLAWSTDAALSSTLGTAAAPATVVDAEPDQDRVDRIEELLAAEAAEVKFATIVDEPIALTSERRLAFLALLSNSWVADPADWQVATDGFLSASADLRGAVQIANSSTVNVGSATSVLPVTVTNQLSQAITVYITVRPSTAVVSVDKEPIKLTVEPNSSRSTRVPFVAVGSDTVQMNVTLRDRLNTVVGGTKQIELSVHAGWETAGTVAFAVLIVLVFGGGIFRNIRKRRKEKAAA